MHLERRKGFVLCGFPAAQLLRDSFKGWYGGNVHTLLYVCIMVPRAGWIPTSVILQDALS
jgi:hypothetical protein